jgi:hypothetical protein
VELSKVRLEIYDFLGLLFPGFILICELWITVWGWRFFANSVNGLGGVSFSVLLLLSFGVGHLVQEFGDATLKRFKGPRFFKRARDDFWTTKEADWVRSAIWTETQIAMGSPDVDAAFDYCLTRLEGRLAKRDSFLASSDLARSLLVLCLFGIAPALRMAFGGAYSRFASGWRLLLLLGALILAGLLAWKRMLRFRELSEVTVFRAYLGTVASKAALPTNPSQFAGSEE